MSSRGGSGRLKLKFSRPMIIVVGVVLALIVIVLVWVYLLPYLQGRGGEAAKPTKPVPTAVAAQGTPGPTRTPHPWAIKHPWAIEPAATAEARAEPTPTTAPGAGGTTPLPVGAGELPASSGSLPWLIPIGVVLLIVLIWWRWRRARATGY